MSALAAAAGLGDRAAFEQLVVATSPAVYALALRLVGNEHDASDVVQETYLRAFRSIDRFRGDAAVSTWLYRIAANCASTHLTRSARSRHVSLDEEMAIVDTRPERDPEAVAGARCDRERVVAALASLPASLRAVVVLRDVYDLPHAAIASELGISRAAAKVRLHRARRRLRELLFPSPARPVDAVVGLERAGVAQHPAASVTQLLPAGRSGRAQAV